MVSKCIKKVVCYQVYMFRYALYHFDTKRYFQIISNIFQKFSKIVFIHFGSTAEVDSRDIKVIIDAVRKAEDIAFIIEESDSEYAVLRQMDNVLLRKGLPLREVMANENVKLRLMCGEPSDLMETLYYGTSVLIFA